MCDVLGHYTPIAAPTRTELETLCTTLAESVHKLLERRALQHEGSLEHSLAVALSRSAARRGADKHAPEGTDADHVGEPGWKLKARHVLPVLGSLRSLCARCPRVDGFDLEATTVVRAEDRERLENLCRYLRGGTR